MVIIVKQTLIETAYTTFLLHVYEKDVKKVFLQKKIVLDLDTKNATSGFFH
eukprot:m.71926 g.71926  ORF g.71926 m.71926 type:complete len:51 (+) comp11719_c0_seq14:218-370(+)